MFRDYSAVEGYQRRLQRMGYESVATHAHGRRYISVDFHWPEYVGLHQRKVGNSIATDEDGQLHESTLRLPGFPKDDFDASVPDDICRAAAEAIGMDYEKWKVIQPGATFHAYHIKYGGGREDGDLRFDGDDMVDMFRAAKQEMDDRFTEEVATLV